MYTSFGGLCRNSSFDRFVELFCILNLYRFILLCCLCMMDHQVLDSYSWRKRLVRAVDSDLCLKFALIFQVSTQ